MRLLKSWFAGCASSLALLLSSMTPMLCVPSTAAQPSSRSVAELRWRGYRAVASVDPLSRGLRRRYRLSTDMPGVPAEREVEEHAGPQVRSGNILFDAMFALALDDERLDRVDHIRDNSFDAGRPIDCVCLETGEKWHYVWTRDVSYAVDLGLGELDPQRSLNSLLFKTSGIRPELAGGQAGPAVLVAQDTGSGGSWPVSTDRVVWILAAYDVLGFQPEARRAALADKIFAIARDTMEQDRRFAFDEYTGLYRGETSFLDWREQNYPPWTRDDVSAIASGYAFSTNVLHVIALDITARLAEQRGDASAERYHEWAQSLSRVANQRFWLPGTGLYASYLSPEPNSTPSGSYDLLGLSLAVIHGIASQEQARSVLQRYPVSAAGPPVLWPQQPDIAIYHNRAIWPFVTAYALRAAKIAQQAQLAGELAESLVRGAALSLSNMENFEFLTQQTRFEDGEASGPVINSPRQLWSVAGYLSMVTHTLWGIDLQDDRLSLKPWLPGRFAHAWFDSQHSLALRGLRSGDKDLTVILTLPHHWPARGWLEARSVSLNGKRVPGSVIALRDLLPGRLNTVQVSMRAVDQEDQRVTRIPAEDSRDMSAQERRGVFAPPAPQLRLVRDGGNVVLGWSAFAGESTELYKNGRLLASGGQSGRYVDRVPAPAGSACYSARRRFDDTGLVSLMSRDQCVLDQQQVSLTSSDGAASSLADGVVRYPDWGAPGEELASHFLVATGGWYRFSLQYANTHGPINTGITAAVKSVAVTCPGQAPQLGSVVMPHLKAQEERAFSSGFFFQAGAGMRCDLRIADGFNMSYLEHFARYTGGEGGIGGALNRADILDARVDLMPSRAP